MSIDKTFCHRPSIRKLGWTPAVILLASLTVGCGDSYVPTKTIEGVYTPTVTAPDGSHCVQIEGRRDGWLSFPTTQPIICQPIRVSELGVMTYGWEVAQPGLKLEVGRVEFSDASIFIATEHLRNTGRFQYTERSPTIGDWTRRNPLKTAMIVLVGLVVTVTLLLRARNFDKRPERERREAQPAGEARDSSGGGQAGAANDDSGGQARDDRRQGNDRPASTHSTDFDPYLILGIRRGASLEEIRSARRSLLQQYHPDKVHHLGQELKDLADKKSKEINRAYEALRGEES